MSVHQITTPPDRLTAPPAHLTALLNQLPTRSDALLIGTPHGRLLRTNPSPSFFKPFTTAILSITLLLQAFAPAAVQCSNLSSDRKTPRIISLAPSNTEMLYSLHAETGLIAVSDICDFPPAAKSKEKAGSFTSAKMEKIVNLHPDLVLLVSGQESIASNLKKHGIKTLTLDNSSIEKIGNNLIELGKASHREAEAAHLSLAFNKSLAELHKLTASSSTKPRVFICVWPNPLMSAGKSSYMNEGITVAGGTNSTADLPQAYPRVNPERLLKIKPDMVLVPQEQAKDKFWTRAPWTAMSAVKTNHVYVLPQHETDCLNRPTLRFVDALYWLAIRLHPELTSAIDKWKARTDKSLK